MNARDLKFVSYMFVILIGCLFNLTEVSGSTLDSWVTTNTEQLSYIPGRDEGTGTYFEITDSYYLNIAVATDVTVNMSIESVPQTITIQISSANDSDSTLLTLMGFAAETTYYMYQDDYHNWNSFTTDQDGSFSFFQDLTAAHTIFIQPRPSTKFIPSDPDIGVWDSENRIFTLTADIGETIQIDQDNLTLDGNGHSIIGYSTGHGVYMSGRTDVTLTNLNIRNFTNGIYLNNCNQILVIENNLISNSAGIYINNGGSNVIESNLCDGNNYGVSLYSSDLNEVLDNTISNNSTFGIYLYSYCDENLISGNSITDNSQVGIEVSYKSSYNEISCNNISNNKSGIDLYDVTSNILAGNTINANNSYGIVLSYAATYNILSTNTCSDNGFGLYAGGFSNNNQIYNNNFTNNSVQVQVFSGTTNVFNLGAPVGGNYYSNWTTPDDNSDGFVDSPYAINAGAWDYLPLTNAVASGCGSIPTASAGPDQTAYIDQDVILDGSGSFDPDGGLLTYYWSLSSIPVGSNAVIEDPAAEVTFFVPDLPGDYIINLVVNNGSMDSEPDQAVITVISTIDAAISNLEEAIYYIDGLSPQCLSRKSAAKFLVNKIEKALDLINAGDYDSAAKCLAHHVLVRIDGCQKIGRPDKGDLIITCSEQEYVYNLVSDSIDLILATP